jgi:hypothetical protein
MYQLSESDLNSVQGGTLCEDVLIIQNVVTCAAIGAAGMLYATTLMTTVYAFEPALVGIVELTCMGISGAALGTIAGMAFTVPSTAILTMLDKY